MCFSHRLAVPMLCSALLVVALTGVTRQRGRAFEAEPA
jgi:AAHS family 4-hydroxybenzoate transporter-like MFS transporter